VRATFLENTTILVSDGTTNLLIDGFFSRPSAFRALFGKIGPDSRIISTELEAAGISTAGSLAAVLVGHAHHDHSLDAVEVAKQTNALVIGNKSYALIHQGSGGMTDAKHLQIVPSAGMKKKIGKFTVTFVPSAHVRVGSFLQCIVEGSIHEPVKMPAHFSKFKCGQVFAIHLAHPHGSILVTTTAGTQKGKTKHLHADVVFLGIGRLNTEPSATQDIYWRENVETLDPEAIIPVHWDSFTRKLS